MANAKDHGSEGCQELNDAQHEARVFYRDTLGGNPMNLPNIGQEHDAALKFSQAVSGAMNQGN